MSTVHPMEADTQITTKAEAEAFAERARKSLHDVSERVSETASDLRRTADKTAKDVKDTAERTAHDLKERAQWEYELGKERLGKAGSEAERLVKQNPVLAIAGAVGVGVLLGLAMGTSRRQ